MALLTNKNGRRSSLLGRPGNTSRRKRLGNCLCQNIRPRYWKRCPHLRRRSPHFLSSALGKVYLYSPCDCSRLQAWYCSDRLICPSSCRNPPNNALQLLYTYASVPVFD